MRSASSPSAAIPTTRDVVLATVAAIGLLLVPASKAAAQGEPPSATTHVGGERGSGKPLVIDPQTDPSTDQQYIYTGSVSNAATAVVQKMPKTMTIRGVTLGDVGSDPRTTRQLPKQKR